MEFWAALLLSIFVGHLAAGVAVWLLRIPYETHNPLVNPLNVAVGGIERAVVTTLFVYAPSLLAGFIGGWMALKFAASWENDGSDHLKDRRLVFIVGSAISLGVAVWMGYLAAPESLAQWAIDRDR